MKNTYWGPFSNALDNFLGENPEDVETVAGFMSEEEYTPFYNQIMASNKEAAMKMGPPGKSPFTRGRAAVIKYPNDAAQEWALKNGSRYGIHVDPDAPWMVRPLGDRMKDSAFKNAPVTASDLLEIAVASMMPTSEFSPESARGNQWAAQGKNSGGTASSEPAPVNAIQRDSGKTPPVYLPPATSEMGVLSLDQIDALAMENIRGGEGLRHYVYDDKVGGGYDREKNGWWNTAQEGMPTIGFGHLISQREQDGGYLDAGSETIVFDFHDPNATLTQEEVEKIWMADYTSHRDGGMHLDNWSELSPELQVGIIDFAFNKGTNVFGKEDDSNPKEFWNNLKTQIETRDWENAAINVDTDWFKGYDDPPARKAEVVRLLLAEASFDGGTR